MLNVTPESYFAKLGSCLILFFYLFVNMYHVYFNGILYDRGRRGRDRMVVGFTSDVKYHNSNPSTKNEKKYHIFGTVPKSSKKIVERVVTGFFCVFSTFDK